MPCLLEKKYYLFLLVKQDFIKQRSFKLYYQKHQKNTTGEEFNNNRLYETLKQLIERTS